MVHTSTVPTIIFINHARLLFGRKSQNLSCFCFRAVYCLETLCFINMGWVIYWFQFIVFLLALYHNKLEYREYLPLRVGLTWLLNILFNSSIGPCWRSLIMVAWTTFLKAVSLCDITRVWRREWVTLCPWEVASRLNIRNELENIWGEGTVWALLTEVVSIRYCRTSHNISINNKISIKSNLFS